MTSDYFVVKNFVDAIASAIFEAEKEEFMGVSHIQAQLFKDRKQHSFAYDLFTYVRDFVNRQLSASGKKQTVESFQNNTSLAINTEYFLGKVDETGEVPNIYWAKAGGDQHGGCHKRGGGEGRGGEGRRWQKRAEHTSCPLLLSWQEREEEGRAGEGRTHLRTT